MKKTGRGNKQKMTFLMTRMIKNVKMKKKVILNVGETETMPYALGKMTWMIMKQLSMLPQKGKVEMKLTKKIYTEPKLETAVKIEKQAVEDEKKLSKVN